jgi:porphobilinogen synthase
MTSSSLIHRPRRMRMHPTFRNMVQETRLSLDQLIYPLFIKESLTARHPIDAMPGYFQLPLSDIADEAAEAYALGIKALCLFGIPTHKDPSGSASLNKHSIVAESIRRIKDRCPDLLVIVDICLCEYTSTGHCGIMNEHSGRLDLDNDRTLEVLAQQAIVLAQAGADVMAPSGMIDGQVAAIRAGLDGEGFSHIPIFCHTAKFASSCYGPFRQIAEGGLKFGDRKTYQLDIANGRAAMREHQLDIDQGVDLLMVKPAGWYLDVIFETKQRYPEMTLGAYQVSGEYSMIKAAAKNGWLDEKKMIEESLIAIRRAGADLIFSYFAKDYALILQTQR